MVNVTQYGLLELKGYKGRYDPQFFELAERTLDTLEPGDIVINASQLEVTVLERQGSIVYLSKPGNANAAQSWEYIPEIKKDGWKVKQPEPTTPETIEIAGKKYDKAEFEKAVKDLKEVA